MIANSSLKGLLITSTILFFSFYVIKKLLNQKDRHRYLFHGKNYRQHYVMNKTEKILFLKLTKSLPHLYIFPQVPFSCIVTPKAKNHKKYFQQLWKINQKRVDFLLCDKNLKNICVIELDGSSHHNKQDTDFKRDKFFKECGLKTVRFKVKELDILTNKDILYRVNG